ncbi:uncharacterized protein [Aegilops tauschii subsp. strangulata]|uniref:uncharacterized protein n=1 Tax=Aegilops tauschii subsp. strangulata TaxID=200361 RepID=UPI00098B7448|nr:uncharacterized protein LOC109782372 [Aegilops tauschii subsp. strangulata]
MEKLCIKEKQLQPNRTVFHGIVPGLSCSPIGKIKIDVLFGDKVHFRREAIWFEVVDLESPYHVLLGRSALAKLMAVPHYAYLKMNMPGTKGIITIAGDYEKSAACAAASSRLAESLVQKALGQHSTEFEYTPNGWNYANLTSLFEQLQKQEKLKLAA